MAHHPESCDTIRIAGLALHIRIGVTDEERAYPQRVILSALIGLDTSAAGRSGRLEDTINYSALAARYRAEADGRSWVLIEELLEQLAELTLAEHPRAEFAQLELRKFAVPGTDHVAIEIRRSRDADPR